jgi:hypothetical protein
MSYQKKGLNMGRRKDTRNTDREKQAYWVCVEHDSEKQEKREKLELSHTLLSPSAAPASPSSFFLSLPSSCPLTF